MLEDSRAGIAKLLDSPKYLGILVNMIVFIICIYKPSLFITYFSESCTCCLCQI